MTKIDQAPSKSINAPPVVTIITVVFNAEKFLEPTILSVVEQGYPYIDFIVIDGGSTDNTVEIIKKYKDKIDFWVSEPDKGIYDAFNKGWNAANIDSFVMYLGAGDKIVCLPDKDVMREADVICGTVLMDSNNRFQSKTDFRLKLGNTVHHQALLVKKSLYPLSPFDLQFRTYADFDFNQRLLKRGVKFTYDSTFVSYALPGGVSQAFNFKESISVVRKNFGFGYSVMACLYYLFQTIKNRF